MDPIVRVIGYTKFLGVPFELCDDDKKLKSKRQDEGSDLARLIECAGRNCYDSYGSGRPSSKYHDHIKEVGHGSVAEHVTINFYLNNISRGCTHELVRHRSGCAVSQRSTRYVDENESSWILHPLLKQFLLPDNTPGQTPQMDLHFCISNAIHSSKHAYEQIVESLQDYMVRKGVDKFTARKQARGSARGLLGNALCTSMVWSANIRALRNCIEQRASPHADAEIRVLFNKIYEEAIKICPEYFDDYEKIDCPDNIGYGLITKFRKI